MALLFDVADDTLIFISKNATKYTLGTLTWFAWTLTIRKNTHDDRKNCVEVLILNEFAIISQHLENK